MVLLCSAAVSFLPVKSAHAWDNQFLLSVTSQDMAGNIITGYYITFWQNGNMLGSGFTPTAFPLTVGQTYQVQAADFGGCTFHNWRDTGSTDRTRSISISTDPEIIAVYSCMNDNFGYPSTTIIR